MTEERRKILRGVFAGQRSWALHDGDRFIRPLNPDDFPVDSPQAMLDLWGKRASVEMEWMAPPEQFLPPLPVGRVFCPAVNFQSHGNESNMPELKEPYFFLKFASSAVAHHQKVRLPPQVEKADYEGEIGIILGSRGKHWNVKEAEKAIFGYTVVNDVSLRDYQFRYFPRYGKNWVMGKAFDDSLPIGPWILPREETRRFQFTIETRVNREIKQSGSTEDMIFSPGELISYLSEVNTLGPGDVVLTGTPAGVAAHGDRKYLKHGDVVEIEVSDVGVLLHYVAREEAQGPPNPRGS